MCLTEMHRRCATFVLAVVNPLMKGQQRNCNRFKSNSTTYTHANKELDVKTFSLIELDLAIMTQRSHCHRVTEYLAKDCIAGDSSGFTCDI